MELIATLMVLGVLGAALLCFCFLAIVTALGRAVRRVAAGAANAVYSARSRVHSDQRVCAGR
ncbi:MAG: hypothetical protein ACT4QF_12270 [Sporichthyaceae bacterium]